MSRQTGAASVRLTPVRIALIYVLVGGLWILVSDQAVAALPVDRGLVTQLQTVKGWVFVGASALLIYALVARSRQQLQETNRNLNRTLQQASVLHRLLRHNLRNACTVIQLEIEKLIEDREDATDARAASAIERQVEALLELGEKSRHLRQIALGEEEPLRLDVVTVVRAEVERFDSDNPAASVTLEAPEQAWVRAHPEIEVAVRELLENTIEHSDGSGEGNPTDGDGAVAVDVAVEHLGETVAVSIADDGPGLPSMERAVLERGIEEPLSHSQGLGLRVVRAIVGDSGGELTVGDDDPAGTVVRVALPAASRGDRAASHRQTV